MDEPDNPLAPDLGPLRHSWDANQVEADLKEVFLELFEAMVRERERRINSYGAPHRAPFEVVERFVKADGLAMERETEEEGYLRELYRGWRSRNPRRGLHFLTHYLQLLWPNRFEVDQLWQDPAQPYPYGQSRRERPGWFLASRVLVTGEVEDPTGEELLKLRGSFRSVLAARLVILMALLRRTYNTDASALKIAGVAYGVQQINYTGVFQAPPTDGGVVLLSESFDGPAGSMNGVTVEQGPAGMVWTEVIVTEGGIAYRDGAGHYVSEYAGSGFDGGVELTYAAPDPSKNLLGVRSVEFSLQLGVSSLGRGVIAAFVFAGPVELQMVFLDITVWGTESDRVLLAAALSSGYQEVNLGPASIDLVGENLVRIDLADAGIRLFMNGTQVIDLPCDLSGDARDINIMSIQPAASKVGHLTVKSELSAPG